MLYMEKKTVMTKIKTHVRFCTAKYLLHLCLLFSTTLASAVEIQYFKIVGLRGLLTERAGIDCCVNGKERSVNFPVIELTSPVNVVSQNPAKPEADEVTEIGVTLMQLVMNDDAWKIYKKLKGKNGLVYCKPFHAINGHHLTAVFCDVQSISNY